MGNRHRKRCSGSANETIMSLHLIPVRMAMADSCCCIAETNTIL